MRQRKGILGLTLEQLLMVIGTIAVGTLLIYLYYVFTDEAGSSFCDVGSSIINAIVTGAGDEPINIC